MVFFKILDLSNMKCVSPETAFGHTWEAACLDVWYPPHQEMQAAGKFWIGVLVVLLVLCCGYCLFMSLKKAWEERRQRRQEEELEEHVAEVVEM